jgi:hypothetical protein
MHAHIYREGVVSWSCGVPPLRDARVSARRPDPALNTST